MVISQTPLRISFVGGGTDFKDVYAKQHGMVLSASIDKYIFVIVTERFDEKIYVNYVNKEIVSSPHEIKHDLVRETLLKVGISQGIEVTMLADIPSAGSGLGSSSSLLVGLLHAFYSLKGELVTSEKLAREACEVEINILGKPVGKQDQYIAAFGGLRKFIFHPDESVDVVDIKIDTDLRMKLGSNLLLHFTNITRQSDSVLVEQKNNTYENGSLLSELASLVPEMEEMLLKGDIDSCGELLRLNWELKKKLASNISNPDIERMTKLAEQNGALGFKIAGAGGGGFLLSYVSRVLQDKYRMAMSKYKELPFMLDPYGSRIIYNMRRYNSKIRF